MAPNRGGPREIIEDHNTGYLFENETELVELTRAVFEGRRRAAIRDMRHKAVEAAARFSRKVFCQSWDKIIYELTQPPSPNRDRGKSGAE
jgi:glycosyltransferase involved in cell wall biosynthesis